MDQNKKDYSDFFKNTNDPQDRHNEQERDTDIEPKQEKPSYYYSYGPYKSSMHEEKQPEPRASYPAASDAGSQVEMTPPRPIRPFGLPQDPSSVQQPTASWTISTPPRKGSMFKSGFAAFLAGAVVVGSLMFASDKMNLFSGGGASGVMTSNGSGSGSAPASSNAGGTKNVALDMGRPDNISSIVQNASPAVVKIETFVKTQSRSRSGSSITDDPFFQYFFGDGGKQTQPKSNSGGTDNKLQEAGMGSGFIFQKEGYILTNQHVVDGADEIQVTVQGYDTPFKAKLLGNSYDLDLAVLKIEGNKEFPILPMSKQESDVNVGDWVVAIGNPYGFDHTVTVGVLSAKERPISIPDSKGTRDYQHLLQTDASINPGNSGGPLLNLNGEVIGINTAVSSQAQGIGFAIPTKTVEEVLDKLIKNVEIPKTPDPYIGITMGEIDQSYLKDLKIDSTDGVLVANVDLGGPAYKAGLRSYDVIQSINGTAVKNPTELKTKVQSFKVGDKITLGVVRDGKKLDLEVTIGNRNDVQQQQQKTQ
ncbi:S1C family serine protease [Paenibacillus sp. MBLB4367]|uniref:S1C family serine protease n=1 Tax=Paenibacillus sp. MBLB4367 TaxID=3384767 RepID=UPI00390821E5